RRDARVAEVVLAAEHLGVATQLEGAVLPLVARAPLHQRDGDLWILREARRDDRAGGSTADDHVVVELLHVPGPQRRWMMPRESSTLALSQDVQSSTIWSSTNRLMVMPRAVTCLWVAGIPR